MEVILIQETETRTIAVCGDSAHGMTLYVGGLIASDGEKYYRVDWLPVQICNVAVTFGDHKGWVDFEYELDKLSFVVTPYDGAEC